MISGSKMKKILNENTKYVLRFEKGEEVVASLKNFCEREGIRGGFLHGLGACDYLKLSFYNAQDNKYVVHEIKEELEIANLTGDISVADGEVMVHIHGTFSDKNLKAIAGHVQAVKISVTCEMLLEKFEKEMKRQMDEETGIKL